MYNQHLGAGIKKIQPTNNQPPPRPTQTTTNHRAYYRAACAIFGLIRTPKHPNTSKVRSLLTVRPNNYKTRSSKLPQAAATTTRQHDNTTTQRQTRTTTPNKQQQQRQQQQQESTRPPPTQKKQHHRTNYGITTHTPHTHHTPQPPTKAQRILWTNETQRNATQRNATKRSERTNALHTAHCTLNTELWCGVGASLTALDFFTVILR